MSKRKLFLDVCVGSNIVNAAPLTENKISKLPQSFDARDWASEFVEIFTKLYPGVEIDEGWMLTWFANSLMSGYDESSLRIKTPSCWGRLSQSATQIYLCI